MVVAALAVGAAASVGGYLLQEDAADDRRDAQKDAIHKRQLFSERVNAEREAQLQQSLGALPGLQERGQANLLQAIGGVQHEGERFTHGGDADVRQLAAASAPSVAPMLRPTSDAQRLAAEGITQGLPGQIARAQVGLSGISLEGMNRQQAQRDAINQYRLDEALLGSDIDRMQQDQAISSGQLNLVDYLNSLESNRRLQEAGNVGQGQQAAGGLLSGIGGSVLGGAIGGLF